jgi:hypothetical protein
LESLQAREFLHAPDRTELVGPAGIAGYQGFDTSGPGILTEPVPETVTLLRCKLVIRLPVTPDDEEMMNGHLVFSWME